MERIQSSVTSHNVDSLKHSRVVQAVKAVCTFMGQIETQEISETLYSFKEVCEKLMDSSQNSYISSQNPTIWGEIIESHCNQIRIAVQGLIEMYCHAFRVEFQIRQAEPESVGTTVMISEIVDWVTLRVSALHRLPIHWKHNNYEIEAQIYHGTKRIGNIAHCMSLAVTTGNAHALRKVMFNSE